MKHVKLFAALLAFVMLGACTESTPRRGAFFHPDRQLFTGANL
ncbi:MAG: hypothetical protein ACLVJK_12380 [Alistipes putredinis]